MADYKEIENGLVQRLSDGATIPPDERNRDRQEYERWLAKGGKPEPYVPPPPPPPMRHWVFKEDMDQVLAQMAEMKAELAALKEKRDGA